MAKKFTKKEFEFLMKNKNKFKSAAEFQRKAKEAGFDISYPTCYRVQNSIGKWKKINKIFNYSGLEKAWNEYNKNNKIVIVKKDEKRKKRKIEDFLKILAHNIQSNKNFDETGMILNKYIPKKIQQDFINIIKRHRYLIFSKTDKIEISENLISKKDLKILNFLYQKFDIEIKVIKELLKKLI